MVLLTTIDIYSIIIMALTLVIVLLMIFLFRALFIRNKVAKQIYFEDKDNEETKNYQNRLLQLIEIKTTSFNDEEGYHIFREKLKEFYPNIHNFFKKEKINGNAIFTYKDYIEDAPNILFSTHIDYKNLNQKVFAKDNEIYGNGTFDAKSLLFVMFEAVESLLKENNKLNANLTMVMTTDDETTKEGASHIVDQFLRKGKFFDLVIEEGSGIVDPTYFDLKSHYALVGLGVTGELKLRFSTIKNNNGLQRLNDFIDEIKLKKMFRARIDRNSSIAIREIAKDMKLKNRLFFNNLSFFKFIAKRIIDKKFIEISRLLKTEIQFSEVNEIENKVFADLTFELSTHDSTADVILKVANLMEKYDIDYEIISNKEATKVTRVDSEGYKIVEGIIKKVFTNIFIIPIIITKKSEKRYFDKVSDCVIRFSPLYYPLNTYRDALKGEEHIPVPSLVYGVNFFKEILRTFTKR